ncbi:glycosyltransferase [Nodularia spumigena]|uniref:Uncharacterized protein n=1 Tax=Nodularia spumigena UHCC 0039 TaxID=1914872 RepID=A0A2S0Q7M5_NODSP|nr:glycosyltransferase [Nodularia spumigena]AVZ30695.1 hypothetical protein BMF81_02571 [Nodularia spumigena UHCC 0039]
MIKPLIINTKDINGGAARAAYRLHQGLKKINIDSTMLVGNKTSDDITVLGPNKKLGKGWGKIAPTLDCLPLIAYPKRQNKLIFSLQWLPDKLAAQVAKINPDLINLHWVNGGYVRIETLAKFKKPMVWTLHDMWAFTGGCHYSSGCDKYTKFCGACPLLESHRESDCLGLSMFILYFNTVASLETGWLIFLIFLQDTKSSNSSSSYSSANHLRPETK